MSCSVFVSQLKYFSLNKYISIEVCFFTNLFMGCQSLWKALHIAYLSGWIAFKSRFFYAVNISFFHKHGYSFAERQLVYNWGSRADPFCPFEDTMATMYQFWEMFQQMIWIFVTQQQCNRAEKYKNIYNIYI